MSDKETREIVKEISERYTMTKNFDVIDEIHIQLVKDENGHYFLLDAKNTQPLESPMTEAEGKLVISHLRKESGLYPQAR